MPISVASTFNRQTTCINNSPLSPGAEQLFPTSFTRASKSNICFPLLQRSKSYSFALNILSPPGDPINYYRHHNFQRGTDVHTSNKVMKMYSSDDLNTEATTLRHGPTNTSVSNKSILKTITIPPAHQTTEQPSPYLYLGDQLSNSKLPFSVSMMEEQIHDSPVLAKLVKHELDAMMPVLIEKIMHDLLEKSTRSKHQLISNQITTDVNGDANLIANGYDILNHICRSLIDQKNSPEAPEIEDQKSYSLGTVVENIVSKIPLHEGYNISNHSIPEIKNSVKETSIKSITGILNGIDGIEGDHKNQEKLRNSNAALAILGKQEVASKELSQNHPLVESFPNFYTNGFGTSLSKSPPSILGQQCIKEEEYDFSSSEINYFGSTDNPTSINNSCPLGLLMNVTDNFSMVSQSKREPAKFGNVQVDKENDGYIKHSEIKNFKENHGIHLKAIPISKPTSSLVNRPPVTPYFSINEGIVRYKRKKNVANRNYFNFYYNAYLNRYDRYEKIRVAKAFKYSKIADQTHQLSSDLNNGHASNHSNEHARSPELDCNGDFDYFTAPLPKHSVATNFYLSRIRKKRLKKTMYNNSITLPKTVPPCRKNSQEIFPDCHKDFTAKYNPDDTFDSKIKPLNGARNHSYTGAIRPNGYVSKVQVSTGASFSVENMLKNTSPQSFSNECNAPKLYYAKKTPTVTGFEKLSQYQPPIMNPPTFPSQFMPYRAAPALCSSFLQLANYYHQLIERENYSFGSPCQKRPRETNGHVVEPKLTALNFPLNHTNFFSYNGNDCAPPFFPFPMIDKQAAPYVPLPSSQFPPPTQHSHQTPQYYPNAFGVTSYKPKNEFLPTVKPFRADKCEQHVLNEAVSLRAKYKQQDSYHNGNELDHLTMDNNLGGGDSQQKRINNNNNHQDVGGLYGTTELTGALRGQNRFATSKREEVGGKPLPSLNSHDNRQMSAFVGLDASSAETIPDYYNCWYPSPNIMANSTSAWDKSNSSPSLPAPPPATTSLIVPLKRGRPPLYGNSHNTDSKCSNHPSNPSNRASNQKGSNRRELESTTNKNHSKFGMRMQNINGLSPLASFPSAVRDSKAKLKEELAEIFNSNFEITRLTPIHLRKAKLMFFYTRYPNSNILKTYFPDIKFNRNNIAQLVKWFSNFREFFYIQIEKHARQALAEGVTDPSNLGVSENSELFRTLIVHYNRNNHIQVPPHFRSVCQTTLMEFFKSIASCRDREPSWKKCIYKIIAQLDCPVPDLFKNQNFLRQLE